MFSRIPFHRVNWITSSFLIGTFVLSITTVPVYLWYFGIDWFQVILFFVLLLFKLLPQQPFDNVGDLKKDRLVMWQHQHVHTIALLVGFALPVLLGAAWNGWIGALGAFLISGVAKVVVIQHCTFFINSACHTLGRRPYSTKCSARDSFLMALLTFGEGYHNYHHEFQHDYRN